MSDLNHSLATEPHSQMNDSHSNGNTAGENGVAVSSNGSGNLLENGSAVVPEVMASGFGATKTTGGHIGIPVTNAPDDSLALGLNLSLVPEALGKDFSATHSNGTGAGSNSTGPASGNNTTIPTPLTMSNGNTTSADTSNPDTNKSSGISGLRRTIGSDHSSPIMSSDISTNTMRMFQRMDEISARLIAMEEMFQKLCKTVEQQSSTIADLKLENQQMSKDILQKVDSIPMQRTNQGDASVQDTFVTDLLNSITNVSSAYLRRMRQSNHSKMPLNSPASRHPEGDLGSSNRAGRYDQNDEMTTSNQFRAFGERQPQQASFTLNPNGIKKRRRDEFSSDNLTASGLNSANITSAAQSYKDLTSLNAFGTISLPNLSLDHTGMTPPLRNGNQGLSFTRMHDASNNNMLHQSPSQVQQPEVSALQQSHVSHPLKNSVTGRSQNDGNKPQEDDDDGYQEDDDDDNDSENSDEEDEEDIEDEMMRRTESLRETSLQSYENAQQNWNGHNVSSNPKADSASLRKVNDNTNKDNGANHSKNSKQEKASTSVNDMNYTLLKAPSNVRTIWDEYTVGIRGHPPIKKLEERFGNKWRLNRNRKTYARRKRLYKFIINGINKGKTADEMIQILEERRLYKDENGEVKRRTIGWLQQSLTGI